MASSGLVRSLAGLTGINALLSGAVFYNTNQKLERNHEESEARIDEVEGTLRGHIGLIEGSLERIEARQKGDENADEKTGATIGQNHDYKTSKSRH